MKRPLAIALALVLAAPLVLLGCGKKNPVKVETPEPFVYAARSTPKGTVLRLAQAYTNRDTVVTASVYADDYHGSSVDLSDPGSDSLLFSKADEVRSVASMTLSNSITYTNADFKLPATWNELHYVSDPSDWITVQIPSFQIEVVDIYNNGYNARAPSNGETWIFEFTLRPTPDASSPTGNTWTIVRWVESRNHL